MVEVGTLNDGTQRRPRRACLQARVPRRGGQVQGEPARHHAHPSNRRRRRMAHKLAGGQDDLLPHRFRRWGVGFRF